MALTKDVAEVDAWAAVALAAVREGATVDLAAIYETVLHIDCCIAGTTAHLGTEIIVQISSHAAGDTAALLDEGWSDLVRFIGPAATAFKADVASTEAVGQTVLSVTDPNAVGHLDHVKKLIFIVDATAANCEIAYLVSSEGDTTDTITVLDGTAYEHLNTADVYTADGENISIVSNRVVLLPFSANRVRVFYNNNYGATGSTVYTRCRISKVTGV